MSVYVTDTHPLIWYALDIKNKLSKKALKIFAQAEQAEALIYVPDIVLWEISFLVKDGEVIINLPFQQWCHALLRSRGFDRVSLSPEIMHTAMSMRFTEDPFDAAITATAYAMDLPLLTKDALITEANLVETIW